MSAVSLGDCGLRLSMAIGDVVSSLGGLQMNQEFLKKRIEQIVEEHKQQVGTAAGTPLSVIVQMETSENLESFLEASVEAIAMRRSVSSARPWSRPIGSYCGSRPAVVRKRRRRRATVQVDSRFGR